MKGLGTKIGIGIGGLLLLLSPVAGKGVNGEIGKYIEAQKKAAEQVVGDRYLTPTQVMTQLKEGKIKVLDVREFQEYISGHIKDSLWIPRGILYSAVKKGKITPDQRLVVVCRTGHRALLAAATLIKWFHFKNVYVMKGGIKGWIEAGGTLSNGLKLGPVKIQLLQK